MVALAPTVNSTRNASLTYWAAAALMVVSLGLATWFTPHATWYERLGQPNYAAIVPASFGDWVDTGESGAGLVSPTQGEALRTIYSQMVSRTYLHKPTGRRIMLSLAYGEVQQGATQLHRPEACYSSQGFTLQSVGPDLLTVGARKLDVFRMTAMIGRRIEQVTYWIRMGDRLIAGSSFNLNLTRMEMGLKGIIADGLLFRVSEISPNATASKQLQDQFVRDLLFTVSPAQQATLIGKPIASLDRQNH